MTHQNFFDRQTHNNLYIFKNCDNYSKSGIFLPGCGTQFIILKIFATAFDN